MEKVINCNFDNTEYKIEVVGNVDKIEGTGLGLVVVKYFIEQHKGTLHIESEIGKYTKIILELPYNLN